MCLRDRLYTGFLWEEICKEEIVRYLDVCVDGEFEVDKKEPVSYTHLRRKTDGSVCAAVKAVLPEFTSGTRKETGISL